MTKRRLVGSAALLGAVLPIVFLGTLYYINTRQSSDVHLAADIERLMLMLWPSSLKHF